MWIMIILIFSSNGMTHSRTVDFKNGPACFHAADEMMMVENQILNTGFRLDAFCYELKLKGVK